LVIENSLLYDARSEKRQTNKFTFINLFSHMLFSSPTYFGPSRDPNQGVL